MPKENKVNCFFGDTSYGMSYMNSGYTVQRPSYGKSGQIVLPTKFIARSSYGHNFNS